MKQKQQDLKLLLFGFLLFVCGDQSHFDGDSAVVETRVGENLGESVISGLELEIGLGKKTKESSPPRKVKFDSTPEPKYQRLKIGKLVEVQLSDPKCEDSSTVLIVHPEEKPKERKYPIIVWAHGTGQDPSLEVMETWASAGFFVLSPKGCKEQPMKGGAAYFQPLSEDQRACVDYALKNFPDYTDKSLKVGFGGVSMGAGASAMSSYEHAKDDSHWKIGGIALHSPHMFHTPTHPTLFTDTEVGDVYINSARPAQKFYLQLQQPKIYLGDSISAETSAKDHFKDVDTQFFKCFLDGDSKSCSYLFGTSLNNICDTGIVEHHFAEDIKAWGDVSLMSYSDDPHKNKKKLSHMIVEEKGNNKPYSMVYSLQACARDHEGKKNSADVFMQGCVGGVDGQACANADMCESKWCEGTIAAGCQGVCQSKREDGDEVYHDGSLMGFTWDQSCKSSHSICGICGKQGSVSEGRTCSSNKECENGLWCEGTITLGCKGSCETKRKDGSEAWANALGVVDESSCSTGNAVCGICGKEGAIMKGGTCSGNDDCVTGHWCEGQVTMGCLGQCKEQRENGAAVFKNKIGVSYDSSCLSSTSVCGRCGKKMPNGRRCWKHSNCDSGYCVNPNTWFSWLGSVGTAACNGVCKVSVKTSASKEERTVEIGSTFDNSDHTFAIASIFFLGISTIVVCVHCFGRGKNGDEIRISYPLLHDKEAQI